MMKKTRLFATLSSLIFLIAFNAVFFIVGGTDHPVSVWLAYGMVHLSYLLLIATPLFGSRDKNAFETSAPVGILSGAHFALEFVIALIVFLVAPDGYKFVLVLYIILLAIYLALFFSMLSVNQHTEASEKRQRQEVFFIRNYASRVQMLLNKLPDAQVNKKIEKAYDELHASPTRSNPQAAAIEGAIVLKIGELELAVRENRAEDAERFATDLLYLVEERNRLIQIQY
jgi:hypothetical protein